jgi:hypothetical protein
MREVTANSWEELNAYLWEKSKEAAIDKWRPYTAFRGLAKRHGNLSTGLQRLNGNLRQKERRVVDCFKMYAREELKHGITDWHVLLLGQHHRLPTRLLDWTSSPLAAMYFATEKHPMEDGEIWCVRRLDMKIELSKNFADILDKQGTNLFSLESLSTAFPRLEDFDAAAPSLAERSLLFFEPPSISPRIINQYAFFSIMPDPDSKIDEYLEARAHLCWKVIVPAGLKKDIRERLLVMNVSERTIYPGLDGLSQWIRVYYQD